MLIATCSGAALLVLIAARIARRFLLLALLVFAGGLFFGTDAIRTLLLLTRFLTHI